MKYDLIIIGGGPAGMTAAIYAARKKLKTLILTRDIGGQAAWSSDVENYLGFSMLSGAELVQKFEDHIDKYKDFIELRLVTAGVSAIERSDATFIVKSGQQNEQAGAIIVASGKIPRRLGLPGESEFLNRGVTYCAWCDGPIFAGRDVAIIGGGNSALDAALSVAPIVKSIYIINQDKELTGDAVMIDKVTQAHNVRIVNHATVKKIEGDKFVSSITIIDHDSGLDKELAVAGVFIEAGSVPADDFVAKLLNLNDVGEIEIDKNNMTSVAGIFAAGDVTNVLDKQIIIAAGEGAKAAIAAARYLSKLQ